MFNNILAFCTIEAAISEDTSIAEPKRSWIGCYDLYENGNIE